MIKNVSKHIAELENELSKLVRERDHSDKMPRLPQETKPENYQPEEEKKEKLSSKPETSLPKKDVQKE